MPFSHCFNAEKYSERDSGVEIGPPNINGLGRTQRPIPCSASGRGRVRGLQCSQDSISFSAWRRVAASMRMMFCCSGVGSKKSKNSGGMVRILSFPVIDSDWRTPQRSKWAYAPPGNIEQYFTRFYLP